MKGGLDGQFKDYYAPIDKEVMVAMLSYYIADIPANQRPAEFNDLLDKCKGDVNEWQIKYLLNQSR